jgi:putative redox protein
MESEAEQSHELKATNQQGTLTTDLESDNYRFVSDQPADKGGKGSGPDPYQLLMGSLAACIAMTLRMYADKKKWPLAKVEVLLNYDRSHLKDCLGCEQPANKLSRLSKKIVLHGELSPGQRSRLLEIAELCPVQKALDAGISVSTEQPSTPTQ